MVFFAEAFAQDAQAPVAAEQLAVDAGPYDVSAEKMMMDNLMILGLLFFLFYFMLIRPQQRKLKAHQKMIKELVRGDKIITGGGIIGTVSKFEGDDIVLVEIAPDVKVKIARSSISDKVDSDRKIANDNKHLAAKMPASND